MPEKTTGKKTRSGFRPLVTADPQDNVSTALNLFYVKDGWTWVRGGGPGPDYADVSLCDFIRQIAKEHSLDIAQSDDDDSISLEMSELLFDGTDTIEGIVATLYTAGWAFAELRERLKAYEKTGMHPKEVAALVTPPNAHLTLDELRKMNGDKIFIRYIGELKYLYGYHDRYAPYYGEQELYVELCFDEPIINYLALKDYGKTWIAYRSKPEEGGHGTAD